VAEAAKSVPHLARLATLRAARRHSLPAAWRYFRALVREFRGTLIALVIVIAIGAIVFSSTPLNSLNDRRPNVATSVYAAWMALLAQPVFDPPLPWHVALVSALYPVLGVLLIGEGVVRFALLMISRRQGEKEWMRVMASTYRDHVILCGLGNLGFRVLQQLTASNFEVVALEHDENSRFVAQAKAMRVPVLIRDMKEDQALIDAGIEKARAIIIATNDDMGNIEVALDSKRMNPKIRVVMRLFEQEIARKISGAFAVDAVFSASSLAAPAIAAMSMTTKVLGSVVIGGVSYVTTEVPVNQDSPLAGKSINEIESTHNAHVLAICAADGKVSDAKPGDLATAGAKLVLHVRADQLAALGAA
jgi:Trk K+ transport system NAD-binding subunit